MPSTLVPRFNPDDRDQVVVPLARAPVPDGPRQTETSLITRRTFDRHWVVVSILAHLVIIGALMFGLLEAPQPAPPPVLKITLVPQRPGGEGAFGGSASAGEAAASPEPATPEIPTPAPEPVSPPAPVKPEIQPPQPAQPEIPKPTPAMPEIQPPSPTPVTTPPPVKATAPPQFVMEIPPPKPRHVPPRHQAARHSEPRPQPTAAPVAPAPAEPAQTKTALATPGVGAGPGKGVEGAGKGAIGNTPGPGDDYLEKLYRHLLRYKKYPPEAIGAKQQGSVTVAFTIARDGTVSDVKIEKSSGSPMLDQATLALVQHASPVPALPDSYKGDAARVKFHIDYKLSLIDQMF